jgi:hypothetical protein
MVAMVVSCSINVVMDWIDDSDGSDGSWPQE